MPEIESFRKTTFKENHPNLPGVTYEYQILADGTKRQRAYFDGGNPPEWDTNPQNDEAIHPDEMP